MKPAIIPPPSIRMSNTGEALTLDHIEQDLNDKIREVSNNPFPVDAMPKLMQGIINETLKTLNFPVDYTGTGILYTTSLCIGNTHKVELKKGHQTSPILWCAVVGSSGVMKTHPLNFALKPIIERDKESVKKFNELQALYKEYQVMDRKEKKDFGPMSAPLFKKTILSDYTLEALGAIHDVNRKGIGVFRDEFAGWFKNFSRYSAGGSDVETWLTMWNGDPLIIDRKSGDKTFISESFVSVIGGIQPDLLDEISRKAGETNGFLSRILFAYPQGLTRQPWNDADLDDDTTNRYRFVIDKLMDLPDETREVLKFEPAAKKIIMEWQGELTKSINDAPESLKPPLSKIDTYGLRLCLIIQLLRWACNEADKIRIDVASVTAGIKLTEYFRANALKVHSYINTTPLDRLGENSRIWYEALPERFTTDQAKQKAAELNLEGLSQRNVHNLLLREDLFKKLFYGTYKKQYA